MKEIPAFIDSKGCDFTISCSDMTYVDHARAVTPYYTPDTIFLPFAIRRAAARLILVGSQHSVWCSAANREDSELISST